MSKEHKRFVIQKHSEGTNVHWDFMLETGDVLRTWRLEFPPDKLAENVCCATKIFDHDLRFLSYEGPVKKGLGNVEIAENGAYQLLAEEEHKIELQLDGTALAGRFRLVHIKNDQWQFEHLTVNC